MSDAMQSIQTECVRNSCSTRDFPFVFPVYNIDDTINVRSAVFFPLASVICIQIMLCSQHFSNYSAMKYRCCFPFKLKLNGKFPNLLQIFFSIFIRKLIHQIVQLECVKYVENSLHIYLRNPSKIAFFFLKGKHLLCLSQK